MASREYQIALEIAGRIDNSLTNATGITKKELRAIAREAAAASASSTTISASYVNAFKKIDPAISKIESFGKKAAKTIATVGTAAAVATAGVATYAIDVGQSFESQMSTVQAITGAYGEDFEALEDKAKELGETTKYTATEVGEAMQYMGMAGWDTDQILAGVSGVMDLASASGEDLATVSDIVTDDMTAFGISLKGLSSEDAEAEVNHFTDVLAAAATSTNTDVEQMGETFKYAGALAGAMGYSIDDVAVATGLMANSGIKATQAGTTLRSLFTRMAKPTKESSDAMEKLGLELTNEDGSMKSFMEVMEQMRDGFADLSEDEKLFYAAEMGGQRGMSGVLAIANATEEDFNDAAAAIDNCAGATEKMADIKLDNLKGDVDIFKSALEGLGLEIYDQANGSLRDMVQTGTDLISLLNEKLKSGNWVANFCEQVEENLPTVIRIIGETASGLRDFAEPFLQIGDWCLQNPDVISSVLIGMASGFMALKAGSLLSKAVSGFSALAGVLSTPVAAGILAVAAAIGGTAGIVNAMKQARKEAEQSNLAEHFGDITLSMEDLDEVAKGILTDIDFNGLDEFSKAADEVDQYKASAEEAIEDINRMNWKVSIGLDLTEEEQSQYISDIDDYVSSVQSEVEQQEYSVNVAMNVLFEGTDIDGSELIEDTNSYFSGKQDELAALGKELQSYVNSAFDDGLLSIDEEKHVSELQQQMADIEAELTQSQTKAKMKALEMDYSGAALDPDSFMDLESKISENITDATQGYAEVRESTLSAIESMYSEGAISDEEYSERVSAAQSAYNQHVGDSEVQGISLMVNSIVEAYGKDLEYANNSIDSIMSEYADNEFGWESNPLAMWQGMSDEISDVVPQDTKDALSSLLSEMQPVIEQLEEMAARYEQAGEDVPQNIQEALASVQDLQALSGDSDAMMSEIGDRVENNDELKSTLNKAGVKIPDQIAAGMDDNKEAAATAAQGIWDEVDQTIQDEAAKGIDTSTDIRISATTTVTGVSLDDITVPFANPFTSTASTGSTKSTRSAKTSSSKTSSSKTSSKKVTKHALGGIMTEPHIGMVAEAGPEAIIPLNSTKRAFDLWQQAGDILGAFKNPKTPEGNAYTSISQRSTINESRIAPVTSIRDMDSSYVRNDMSQRLLTLNRGGDRTAAWQQSKATYQTLNTLREPARTAQILEFHANGGIFDQPHVGMVAEAGPEAVIPINGSQNSRMLLEQTTELMGTNQPIRTESINRMADEGPAAENSGSEGEPGATYRINFNPTYQFYGEAPSKKDMVEAAKISQDDFNEMMDRWMRDKRRYAF